MHPPSSLQQPELPAPGLAHRQHKTAGGPRGEASAQRGLPSKCKGRRERDRAPRAPDHMVRTRAARSRAARPLPPARPRCSAGPRRTAPHQRLGPQPRRRAPGAGPATHHAGSPSPNANPYRKGNGPGAAPPLRAGPDRASHRTHLGAARGEAAGTSTDRTGSRASGSTRRNGNAPSTHYLCSAPPRASRRPALRRSRHHRGTGSLREQGAAPGAQS
ncbi:serine/arginine repetitive matrix protein 1-like [Pezoporus wallicus]|uniref:serine/arginine repetitive matrix protein 1-like n=1 Tax=Pezoporus wallicus TaxID=35540 RepID=UPI002549F58B|nr:serine/arginine repetitive matrix protein 1-like [Pezoporus wallicus]